MRKYYTLILLFSFPISVIGQVSFWAEIGINDYDFNEKDPGGFSLNEESSLFHKYFGLSMEKQLSEQFSISLSTHYSFVKHDVELNSPVSNPIVVFRYDALDLMPLVFFWPHRNIKFGTGLLIQNQIRKKYIVLSTEELHKAGSRNFGYAFTIECRYKKVGISILYKALFTLPEDLIFQYENFYGLRAGISYKLFDIMK